MNVSRRGFLKGGAGMGLAASLGGLGALLPYSPKTVAETVVTPEMVRFTKEMEPIVRLIEKTPRKKAVEVMAREIRKGLPYRQFLAAIFLAGIRNVNPQPPGFKFHCVFIIHSANYLSEMSPPEERLLPLFWTLDDFKKSQEEDVRLGDFVLRNVAAPLPSPSRAWDEFHDAMNDWDEEKADGAITVLVREKSPEEIFEGLWEYGARDYRNIGHKAIFVAHARRTLEVIGWQHAEPTLRSLVLGLLDFGKTSALNGYAFEDQCYRTNVERVKGAKGALPGDWAGGRGNSTATEELLAPLRQGKTEEACDHAVRLLAEGKCQVQALWDAVHMSGAELMMRQPGIGGIHTVTSANALRHGFHSTRNEDTRLLMVLQALGWMSQFRNFMDSKRDQDLRVTELRAEKRPLDSATAIEEILAEISNDRNASAQKAFEYASSTDDARPLFDAARRLVFMKASEHHHLKWPAAIFEDYYRVSPQWRPQMVAASMYYLRGSGHGDSRVTLRALDAMKRG